MAKEKVMRAIKIVLTTEKPITLPLAYNELIQGLLYSCWRESFPELHDEGFGKARKFRLFTFSPLTGKCRIDSKAKTIEFYDLLTFEVRSPVEELLDELARRLCVKEHVRIGAYNLKLVNLQSCDRLLFRRRAKLRMLSPVTAYRTTENGYTENYSPLSAEWLELIQSNPAHKAKVCSLDCDSNIIAIPCEETLRKHVTRFKGTYVTGWTGDLIVAADPIIISLLYFAGIGPKNSQGFGMFSILDKSF